MSVTEIKKLVVIKMIIHRGFLSAQHNLNFTTQSLLELVIPRLSTLVFT